MIVGAIASLVALLTQRAFGLDPMANNNIGYWIGAAMGGALFGLAVAAFLNRRRT